MAFVGVRDHPESEPRAPNVAERNDGADQDREDGDGLRTAGDGPAPSGIGKTQNGGDQRACMADADPEDEIGDVECPEDRGVYTPDADPGIELITKCSH